MASMFSKCETLDIAFKFLSTSVSLAGILMFLRSVAGEVFLERLRSYFFSFFDYFFSFFGYLFTRPSTNRTAVINEFSGNSRNEVYEAADIYLAEMINPETKRFRLSKTERQKDFAFSIENDEEIVDISGEIQFKWTRKDSRRPREKNSAKKNCFELSFNKKLEKEIVNGYLTHVLDKAKEIKKKTKLVKIYNRDCPHGDEDTGTWGSMILEHPATFDTMAMDPSMQTMIITDLEMFVKRKEYYKKVGKAWKRGYLLSGPPGTGKSSLIAAMANHLKFDIYDLELASIRSNSGLRNVLLSTTSRSILVIEDIDCSIPPQDRKNQLESDNSNTRLTLSGILNFMDGLWSSCVDERIIVFTTNHKDRLDPALLRPGRMDVEIDMSYCTVVSFRILASNYLDISNRDPRLLREVENLIRSTKVTPAEVAGELMKSEVAGLALQGLVKFIKHKRSKCDKIEDEVAEIEEENNLKSDNEEKDISVGRKRRGESGWQHEHGEESEGQGID